MRAKRFLLAVLVGSVYASVSLAEGDTTRLSATSSANRVPVVELYTSEGCSSCPRADEWISKLGEYMNEELNAVPLAFHVDYWNYLGWNDPYSQAKFTKRQRFLGDINEQRSIYTPEFLVSGEETRGTRAVLDAIIAANDDPAKVSIEMAVERDASGALSAELGIDSKLDNAALYLAIYENDIIRKIEGGENNGRTLHHDFVVRHWDEVALISEGRYDGIHSIRLGDDWVRDNIGLAAIIVDRNNSRTLQAVRLDLAPLAAL